MCERPTQWQALVPQSNAIHGAIVIVCIHGIHAKWNTCAGGTERGVQEEQEGAELRGQVCVGWNWGRPALLGAW